LVSLLELRNTDRGITLQLVPFWLLTRILCVVSG